MRYEVIMEKGKYALIDRGEKLKEFAVVNGLDRSTRSWAATIGYWAYEFDGAKTGEFGKAEALSEAVDLFRRLTEDGYVPRNRLEELAVQFKDGLIEDGEEAALEFFEKVCEMTENEKKWFGL